MAIRKELLDELLKDYKGPEDLLEGNGFWTAALHYAEGFTVFVSAFTIYRTCFRPSDEK